MGEGFTSVCKQMYIYVCGLDIPSSGSGEDVKLNAIGMLLRGTGNIWTLLGITWLVIVLRMTIFACKS